MITNSQITEIISNIEAGMAPATAADKAGVKYQVISNLYALGRESDDFASFERQVYLRLRKVMQRKAQRAGGR